MGATEGGFGFYFGMIFIHIKITTRCGVKTQSDEVWNSSLKRQGVLGHMVFNSTMLRERTTSGTGWPC